jgi:hypothetical protein
MKTTKYWRRKLKKTLEDGKTSHVHESSELILWKCPYYWKKFTDSMQSPSKSQYHSSQNDKNSYGSLKNPK